VAQINSPNELITPALGGLWSSPFDAILTKQKVAGLKTFGLCNISSAGKGGLGRRI